jgi:hypothetical protein
VNPTYPTPPDDTNPDIILNITNEIAVQNNINIAVIINQIVNLTIINNITIVGPQVIPQFVESPLPGEFCRKPPLHAHACTTCLKLL